MKKEITLTTRQKEIFSLNSKFTHNTVKNNLIKIEKYECVLCGNKGTHQGKRLTLQLDHINGNKKDQRLQNLRFLCPNCHSQTKTFAGGNRKNIKVKRQA